MELHFHESVRDALHRGAPVVALESTLITHGFPRPLNLEIAEVLEAAVCEAGAVPATIAILDGRIHVGLTPDELRRLAVAEDVRKCSRRDLGIVAAQGGLGATTVAGTMIIAARAGIRVFATGGIGGVHRGNPFDVSADIEELARTPVTVVCAGAKSILDLPKTVEALETRGVPVIGYGTDEFAAFYTRESGLPVDARCDSPAEVAAIVACHWGLDLRSGVLVTVPVPADVALPASKAEAAIELALEEADRHGIRGKQITPFLLQRVSELTVNESREANIALLKQNAAVAAWIAAELAAS